MALLSQDEAQSILEKNGYRILDYLGKGAASYVFHASRKKRKTGGSKEVAVKVCYDDADEAVPLEEEVQKAEILKALKDEFKRPLKKQIEEAKKNGQTRLADELSEKLNEALEKNFKYLTVPKLVKEVSGEFAIFEAPLADSDIQNFKIDGIKSTVCHIQDRYYLANVELNYRELKRFIKSILKGLKVIHDNGKWHGDIAFKNILKKFDDSKGKYRYYITDFGTLEDIVCDSDIQDDFRNASCVFLGIWLQSLGACNPVVKDENNVDKYFKRNLERTGIEVALPQFKAIYYPNTDDKELIDFCKKLREGDFKSAEKALEYPWLRK